MALAGAATAQAGPFTRLQVLLPGETAAPGTPTGKTGTPLSQIVGAAFEVTVRACDNDWYTVTNVTDLVGWGATDESATLPPTAPLSGGLLTAMVTLQAAGTFTISGQDLSDQTVSTAYSAGVTAVVMAGFQFDEITQKNQTAGAPFTISLTAVDPDGNRVGGFTGPVNLQQFTSYGLGRISPATVTLDGGNWTGQVSVFRADETNLSRGNASLYTFLSGDTSLNGTSSPFVVHPGVLKRAQLVLPGQTTLPGSVDGVVGTPASQGAGQPFIVGLNSTDDYWNPVSSSDMLRVTSSDAGANTPVTVTLVGGLGQASLQLSTVGAQTLTVNDLSNGSVRPMTSAPVVVIPSYAHHFEFDPLPGGIVAGADVIVTIRATDAGGNTIPNFNGDANLTANTGQGSLSRQTVRFTNGVWGGVLKFYGAGAAVQVTCSDYASPPHVGTSNAVQVLAGAYVATQVLLPGQVARGGTSTGLEGTPVTQDAGVPFVVHIRAVDRYFNRVMGINNPVVLNSADPNMSVPAGQALVNGEVTVSATIYTSGSQTLNASDATSQGIGRPNSSTFNVRAGPYARLLLLAPGQAARPGAPDGRSGTATDQSITYQFTLTALTVDQWFNQVTGVADVVHLGCTDPAATLPADRALVDGKAFLPVRMATGGFQQFTLTSVSTPGAASSTTQVRAISSGLHLVASIAETAVQAGVPFTLVVKMVNDAGTVIQEVNSGVQVAVRNANTQARGRGTLSSTSFQLLQGRRTVSLDYTFAEPVILEVSDSAGSTPGLTGPLNVQPGPPASLALSSSPGWVPANRTATVRAVITDEFGNPVPNQTVTFATAAGDSGTLGEAVAPGEDKSVIALTNETGVAAVPYHSPREAQTTRVTASSGSLSATYDLQTALVDPDAAGGHITSYPNPFHPDETPATIAYVLDDNASVRMRVYTISGGLVLDRHFAAGDSGGRPGLNEVQWDGRNGSGEPVASGGYIVYVEAEGTGATQHVMRRKIGVVW